MTHRSVPWEIDRDDEPSEGNGGARSEPAVDHEGAHDPALESALDSDQEASYACWACGEEIVIPVDLTMGNHQNYVEDCPVCCRPNEIHVELEPESGHVRCWNDPVG